MPKYLYLRPDGRSRNWHVRVVAPTDVHDLLPTSEREFRRSTGTADKKKAAVVAARVVADLHQKWDDLRSQRMPTTHGPTVRHTVLTSSLIEQLCHARLGAWASTDDGQRLDSSGIDDTELAEMQDFCRYSDAAMRSVLAQGTRSDSWSSVVTNILEWCVDLGHIISPNDPLFPILVRKYAEVEKKCAEIIAARNVGESVSFPDSKIGASLSDVIQYYVADKGERIARKVLTTNLSIWQRFVEFAHNVPLDSISSREIYDFLYSRLHDKDAPWSEGYALGRAKNTLKEFFALARTKALMSSRNPVLEMDTNPGLNAKVGASRLKPRFPFDSSQLNTILSSDWYRRDSGRFKGGLRTDLGMRYWGPLILMFHGLRVREMVQLHSHDLRYDGRVMLMSIQTDLTGTESEGAAERSLKNEATIRTVPVHPKLIELGFTGFVKAIQEQYPNGAPLFPSAVPDPLSKSPLWGRSFEQAFLRFVRDELGFGHGYGNHSFRHTVEDRVRDAQLENGVWPAGLSQFYTGRKLVRRADLDVTRKEGSESGYGRGYNPAKMLDYVSQIVFPGVTLPQHFKVWSLEG